MDNQQMQALLMLGQLASKGQQGNQLGQLAPLLMMMKGSNAGQASGKGQQQPPAAPTAMSPEFLAGFQRGYGG